jgi:hypothetical protein
LSFFFFFFFSSEALCQCPSAFEVRAAAKICYFRLEL